MSIGKWKLPGSRKRSTTSSQKSSLGHSETATKTTTISSSRSESTTGTSSPSSTGDHGYSSSKTSTSTSSLSTPFSWLRSPRRSSKKRKSTISRDDPAFARLHKPFTPQNLEHQKLLSAFEWNFGCGGGGGDDDDDDDDNDNASRRRQRRYSDNLSPCATRDTTVDSSSPPPPHHRRDDDDQLPLSSSFAQLSMKDASSHDRRTAA